MDETELIAQDDGSYEEVPVYRSKAGNIVTRPELRSKGGVPDPRQQVCWDYYIKTLRAGMPNAQEAARHAGYSPNTCLNVTNLTWFKKKKKNLGRASIGGKAERNLSRGLDVKYSKMKLMDNGDMEEVIDKDLFKTVMGVSQFIAGTLLKDEGYSSKTEVVGRMDGEIKINSISYADPIQIESQVVDEEIKKVEDIIIREVIEKDANN